jgi:hypothetical protein
MALKRSPQIIAGAPSRVAYKARHERPRNPNIETATKNIPAQPD